MDHDTIHAFDGYQTRGSLIAARCRCGWSTRGQADRTQALLAMAGDHVWSAPICARCGRDRADGASADRLHDHFRVIAIAGCEALVCADDTDECDRLVRSWEALGPMDELGLPMPRSAAILRFRKRRG